MLIRSRNLHTGARVLGSALFVTSFASNVTEKRAYNLPPPLPKIPLGGNPQTFV